MYYINTICGLLNLKGIDPTIERYRKFHDYKDINDKGVQELLDTANCIRPRLLLGLCLFVDNEKCKKAGYASLTFPKTPSVIKRLQMPEDYVDLPNVGRIEITKVFVVKRSWLKYMFTEPYSALERGLQSYYLEEEEEEVVRREEENLRKMERTNCMCTVS
ncbi:uncharacterized protein LOC127841128 [Dreissena polymorpha]|nr:uncharacterized protein LOC127841128 [Dreissena polymorpha]